MTTLGVVSDENVDKTIFSFQVTGTGLKLGPQ